VTPTGIATPDPPQTFPIWRWADNSCSLDSSLLVALMIYETLPHYVQLYELDSNIACRTLWRRHQNFVSKGLAWVDRPLDKMTKTRDAVRRALLNDHRIDIHSAIDLSLLRLIPAPMRQIRIRCLAGCKRQACWAKSPSPDIDRPQGTGVATAFPVKEHTPDFITYPAQWQRDSDTQSVLDRIVSTLSILF